MARRRVPMTLPATFDSSTSLMASVSHCVASVSICACVTAPLASQPPRGLSAATSAHLMRVLPASISSSMRLLPGQAQGHIAGHDFLQAAVGTQQQAAQLVHAGGHALLHQLAVVEDFHVLALPG